MQKQIKKFCSDVRTYFMQDYTNEIGESTDLHQNAHRNIRKKRRVKYRKVFAKNAYFEIISIARLRLSNSAPKITINIRDVQTKNLLKGGHR